MKNSHKAMSVKLYLIVVLALGVIGAAFAQTSGGAGGEGPNWATQSSTLSNGLIDILTAVFPAAVGLLAIMMGPRILKGVIKQFSK